MPAECSVTARTGGSTTNLSGDGPAPTHTQAESRCSASDDANHTLFLTQLRVHSQTVGRKRLYDHLGRNGQVCDEGRQCPPGP